MSFVFEQVIKRLTIGQSLSQTRGRFFQFAIRESFVVGLKVIDSGQRGTGDNCGFPLFVTDEANPADASFVGRTKHSGDESLCTTQNYVECVAKLIEDFHNSSVEKTRRTRRTNSCTAHSSARESCSICRSDSLQDAFATRKLACHLETPIGFSLA